MNTRRDSRNMQTAAIHVEQHVLEPDKDKKPTSSERQRKSVSVQQKTQESERAVTSSFVFDRKLYEILRQVNAIDKTRRQQQSRLNNPSSLRASPDISSIIGVDHRHGDALLDQLQIETLGKDAQSLDTLGKINEIVEISEQVKNKKQILIDIKKDMMPNKYNLQPLSSPSNGNDRTANFQPSPHALNPRNFSVPGSPQNAESAQRPGAPQYQNKANVMAAKQQTTPSFSLIPNVPSNQYAQRKKQAEAAKNKPN